jgi:hypothetical protein
MVLKIDRIDWDHSASAIIFLHRRLALEARSTSDLDLQPQSVSVLAITMAALIQSGKGGYHESADIQPVRLPMPLRRSYAIGVTLATLPYLLFTDGPYTAFGSTAAGIAAGVLCGIAGFGILVDGPRQR